MSQPVFKNNKGYDVEIPTPNGGYRNVPAGKFVIGDYFLDFARQTGQLIATNEVPKEKDIVCVFTKQTVAQQEYNQYLSRYSTEVRQSVEKQAVSSFTETVNETSLPVPEPVVVNTPPPVVEEVVEVKKKGGRPPKKSYEDIAKEISSEYSKVLPTVSEVDNLSNEELKKLGQKLGISPSLGRTPLIEAIKKNL